MFIKFSEAINVGGINPYEFLDKSTNLEFIMELSSPDSIDIDQVQYKVYSKSIDYVVSGDSISITTAGVVSDILGNFQTLTVRKPITVTTIYESKLELIIVPQPLTFINEGGTVVAKELSEELMNYYNFPAELREIGRGVAFLLRGTGPLAAVGEHRGEIKILDNVGNEITDVFEMVFTTDINGSISGVAIWDGKNKQGRTVGQSAYVALVNVNVKLDDGHDTKLNQKFIKMVGVRSDID
jgi:hypothetical protein